MRAELRAARRAVILERFKQENAAWIEQQTKKNHGLGDLIEKIAKPFAKMMRLPCLDADGKLVTGSPCAKRRDALNKLLPL